MANKLSSIKRARQNEARRIRNKAVRSDMRTSVKTVQKQLSENSVEGIDSTLSKAQSKLAKAAKRNIIKKNKLARMQSRLMKAAAKAKKAEAGS